MILDPSGPDRALLADQLFARMRAGATRSEAAEAIGLTNGQARRMTAAFAARRNEVHAEIDDSIRAAASSQTPPATPSAPPVIVRAPPFLGASPAALARHRSAAAIAAAYPSEATAALAANALALYEREAVETSEQRQARLLAEERAGAEERRFWGGTPDDDSFGA